MLSHYWTGWSGSISPNVHSGLTGSTIKNLWMKVQCPFWGYQVPIFCIERSTVWIAHNFMLIHVVSFQCAFPLLNSCNRNKLISSRVYVSTTYNCPWSWSVLHCYVWWPRVVLWISFVWYAENNPCCWDLSNVCFTSIWPC